MRGQMAALQTHNADALATSQVALKGAQTKFFGDIAATGVNAFSGYGPAVAGQARNNFVNEREQKKLIHPWATGRKDMGAKGSHRKAQTTSAGFIRSSHRTVANAQCNQLLPRALPCLHASTSSPKPYSQTSQR